MKLLPSIGFSDFSGSAGNVTARKSGAKTYLSTRTKHSRKKTTYQAATRCRFSDTVRGYAKISEDQRRGWNSLAGSLGTYSSSSGNTSITGHNLYVAINTYRKICGKPQCADAPATLKPSDYINMNDDFDMWLSPERVFITGVIPSENPDDALLIEMYAAQSAGEASAWNKTVIAAVLQGTDWGDVDLTQAFLKKFITPLTLGQMIYIKMCWIDAECGYVKRFTRFYMGARETSLYNRVPFVPRARVTTEQLTPVTQDAECTNFDYGLSPVFKMTSNSISAKHHQGYAWPCEFSHNGLPSAFDTDRTYQYSRCTEEKFRYMIQCTEVMIWNSKYSKTITLTCRAGNFTDHFETFGTYFVTS